MSEPSLHTQYETLLRRGMPVALLADSKGREMLADTDSWPGVKHWYAHHQRGRWYAIAVMHNGTKTPLHRIIVGAKRGELVDHINGNGLDNRHENLRICTHQENCCNRKKTGVTYEHSRNRQSRPWKAQIKHCGVNHHIGRFATRKEAVSAYNAKAQELHGEFARDAE